MNIKETLHDFFTKGKISMGLGKSLANITDDPRVNLPVSEIERIREDLRYYRNDMKDIKFYNSKNELRQRPISSLAVTRQAARQLASLIFNEGAAISVQPKDSSDNDELDTFIDKVLTDNLFKLKYEEYLETGIVTGGFAIRPYIENDKIKLAWIRADQFVPLQSNTNDIQSAVIVNKTTVSENNKNVWYSLLEFHEFSEVDHTETVTNELYRSETPGEIGKQVPLGMLDQYEGLSEQAVINGLVRPTFTYFKTPGKNNQSIESPLGVGIVENSKHIIDAINMTHDQYVRELKLGKRRIAISAEMLKPRTAHAGDEMQGHPEFDPDDDVVMQVGETKDGKGMIEDLTSPLRTVQYTTALTSFLHELENNIGLSQGTLSSDGAQQDKTATEVVSDNSETYRTRSSYITQVQKNITELIISIVELGTKDNLFDNGAPLEFDLTQEQLDIHVKVEDGVFVDKNAQAQSDMLAVQQQIMPKKVFLQRNYGLSDDDADKWLSMVQSDQPQNDSMSAEQSALLGGSDGGSDDE